MHRTTKTAALFLVVLSCAAAAPAGENPAFQDYQAFLKQFPLGVMTTVEGDQPRTRVFQYLFSEDDKVFFCTGASKDVHRQLQANNRVSFCTWDPKTATVLSVDGPVTFVTDPELKKRALDGNPGILDIYKSPDNPEFVLFHISPETIYTFNFAGGKQFIKR